MKLSNIIHQKHNIAIFGHTNIDGDCLGSMLALGNMLEILGHNVDYIADQPASARSRLPGVEKISPDFNTSKTYDLRIGVDFSPRHRTGSIYKNHQEYFDQLKENVLIIDHHVDDNYHATRNLKDSKADANCVWLYELFLDTGWQKHITPQVATYLLMGIMTDTGRFTFDSQPERILRTASELITLGADKPLLIHHLYRDTDPKLIPIMQECLKNYRLEQDILITYRDENTHSKIPKQERDIILNFLQGLAGYKVCAFATIVDQHTIKLSLRSKQAHEISGPIVDCNKLAQTHFSGGGHIHAAGGIYLHNQKPIEAIDTVFSLIDEHIHP